MKPLFLGIAATAVIGVVAYFGLHNAGWSSQEVYSSENVRLD